MSHCCRPGVRPAMSDHTILSSNPKLDPPGRAVRQSRGMIHRPAARLTVALALAAFVASGCSRAAIKSQPIWDSGAGAQSVEGAEDRINVWPLFYYREPALSILWPIFAATGAGHALIPFYEYLKDERDLRIGTIHPWLPSLARFDGSSGKWRVLTLQRDKRRDTLQSLPFYHQDFDDKKLWILPIVYREKDEIWTPLLTWGDDIKGILGPLFFRYTGSNRYTSYHLPFPFVWFARGEDFLGYRIFPVVDYESSPGSREASALLGLGGYERKSGRTSSHLIPFWFHEKRGSRSRFVSLPYTHLKNPRRELTNIGLFAYLKNRDSSGTYTSVLFPSFHSLSGEKGKAHMVAPLYATIKKNDGGRQFYSLPFNYQSGGKLLNILGPLYFQRRDGETNYRTVGWPFFQQVTGPDGGWSALAPIFFLREDASGEKLLVTPLGGGAWGGDSKTFSLLGPAYVSHNSPGRKYRSLIWPFFIYSSQGEDYRHHLAPLYHFERHDGVGRFTSLPFSYKTDGSMLNIAGPLFYRSSKDGAEYTTALFPFAHRWKKDGETRSAIFPFYYSDSSGGDDGERKLITPLGGYSKGGAVEFLDILGPLYYSRTEGKKFYKTIAWPFLHRWSDGKKGGVAVAPLFARQTGPSLNEFYSLPLSFGRDENFWRLNLALLLFHGEWRENYSNLWTLAGLVGLERDTSEDNRYSKFRISPLVEVTRDDYVHVTESLLFNLNRSNRDSNLLNRSKPTFRINALLRMFEHESRQIARYTEIERSDGSKEWTHVQKGARGHFFSPGGIVGLPKLGLVSYDIDPGGRSEVNVLWRLYASNSEVRDDGTLHRLRRVLWYVFRQETTGDHTDTDAFPFISVTSDPGRLDWRFAGGLVGYANNDGARTMRLLYFPIRWGKAKGQEGEADGDSERDGGGVDEG